MIESFDREFLELLAALNARLAETGEKMEGNLLYKHHDRAFPYARLAKYFATKRANILAACCGRGRVLEIGVNGGHAALLMLYHTPGLHYTGVDIGDYRYSYLAMDFLRERFPGRADFVIGDSRDVLPRMISRPERFDVVHIDAMHTLENCQADTLNAIALCNPFAWVVIDDTDLPHIRQFYDELIASRTLLANMPSGWTPDKWHAVGMTPR